MNLKHILGIFLIAFGFVMLSSNFSGLTGYAVIEIVNQTATSFIGLVLVISGILVLALGTPILKVRREIEGGLAPLVKESTPEATPENTETILDANFWKYLPEEYTKGDFFGNIEHSVPEKVVAEMTHRSASTHQPLVPSHRINYLLNTLKTKINREKPAEIEKTEIYNIWQRASPKAKFHDEHKKFKESGEMDILCYALRVAKTGKYIYILSNDTDVISVAKKLREDRRLNVYVIKTKDIENYIKGH